MISRLEKHKCIEFNPRDREALRKDFVEEMKGVMMTEQDLNEIARDSITGKAEDIADHNITETEAFKMRKKDLKDDLGENLVAGFYLTSSLREVCRKVPAFFLRNKYVEDVFESDETIQKMFQELLTNFDESKIS